MSDEIERLRTELAAAHGNADDNYKKLMEARAELAKERERADAHYRALENVTAKNERLRAERDALLALLRSAVMQLPEHRRARFEDALKGDGDE